MKCRWIIVSLALNCLIVSPARSQSQSEQVRQLLEQMQSLQEKLKSLEASGTSSATKERTTQLGRTRIREEEAEWVVRIYDLSDLLAPISAYPATLASDLDSAEVSLFPNTAGTASAPSGVSGMGGMGGMMNLRTQMGKPEGDAPQTNSLRRPAKDLLFQASPAGPAARPKRAKTPPVSIDSARIELDNLIDAIKTTIEPTSWDDTGGRGSIAPLGNSLIISTTPTTHDQIAVLLDSFRKRWGTLRTVTVEARWLWLTETQLAGLLTVSDQRAETTESNAFGLVNDAAWEAHVKELLKADREQPPGYQAAVTCYNGQTVHTVSGEQHRFVTGLIPVIGDATGAAAEANVGYQPLVATLQEGAALQVTPMTTTAGRYVVLDVHSRVVRLRDKPVKEPDRPPQFGAQAVAGTVDRPVVERHSLETTLRVPVDRRMLVGGMTFAAQPKRGDPGLYLFVKLTVRELRDDLPGTRPEVKPAAVPTLPLPISGFDSNLAPRAS